MKTKAKIMGLVVRKAVYGVCEQRGADQPVHPRRLISAFDTRLLESVLA